MRNLVGAFLAAALVFLACAHEAAADELAWAPVEGQMMTRWAKDVTPETALPEYPRPMMVRDRWVNLNGLWEFTIVSADELERPAQFDKRILVPFAAESALSGIKQSIVETDRLWYRRTFEVPDEWKGQRILLHFAADWETTVWVNGETATHHRGGYDPFSVDITDMLRVSGPQDLVVSVWDPTNKGHQPRGKQEIIPHGFMYTPTSGIWQTVWIEPVAASRIRSVYTEPDIDANLVWVIVDTVNTDDAYTVEARTLLPGPGETEGTRPVSVEERAGQRLRLSLRNDSETRLWSPDSPYLYDLRVTLKNRAGETIDTINSHFGMRKISVDKDERGINRLFLNNKPLFHYGFLDQGWWPDGLYTAPTDEALRYDIEMAKRLGANMVRKHVKFEPQRFYYWCDKLGIMVWQDMPAGNNGEDLKGQFELELKRMIDTSRSHPSIVMWLPFNEGWGQFDAPRLAQWVKRYDPTRLINHASGWADRGEYGDVRDIHLYPEPGVAPPLPDRAIILGEFGGISMDVEGHEWADGEGWGYSGTGDSSDLTEAYLKRVEALPPMIGAGLSAACYTQIADQEIEANGVMTYDRDVLKMDEERAAAAAMKLYETPPVVKTVLADSSVEHQTWQYTMDDPGVDWYKNKFNDSKWKTGPGGFGYYDLPTYPLIIIETGTEWHTPDIWLRRTFDVEDTDLTSPFFLFFYNDAAEVYLNGKRVLSADDAAQFYRWIPIDEAAAKLLKKKGNTIAVHASNEHHPQFIDVGIVDVVSAVGMAGE